MYRKTYKGNGKKTTENQPYFHQNSELNLTCLKILSGSFHL